MTTASLSHIVAMASNRAIGRAGQLPWHIPEDFKLFKRMTMGHRMLMGRKTFASIGRALPGRQSLVISRDPQWQAPPGVLAFRSLEQALAVAREPTAEWGSEVFIIGGGELYRQTLPLVTTVYLTLVDLVVTDADTFYPELPPDAFALSREEAFAGPPAFTWRVYQQNNPQRGLAVLSK